MSVFVNTTLNFFEPTIENYPKFSAALKQFSCQSMSCEVNPITLLLWKDLYKEKIAFCDDMFFISAVDFDEPTYLLPFAKDMEKAVALLKEYAKSKGQKLTMFAAEGERLDRFLSLYKNDFDLIPSRDDFEYLYNMEDLRDLSGKKYHSKRNHISAFNKTYDWSYESLSKENFGEVLKMADKWHKNTKELSDQTDIGVDFENAAIKRVLPLMDKLGIKGGVIRIDGQVVAFCFGSPINDRVFDVQVEKALPEFRTAYSVINQEFVKNELQSFKYINREEDLGLEGLRKAKLSYKPEILLKKYVIRAK